MPIRAWRGALAAFVLAALTGAFFRFVVLGAPSFGLAAGDVRHAHSHLMLFGWVTPALVALIAARLPGLTGRPAPRGLPALFVALFATALAAWLLFARHGYAPTRIGSASIPLSTIAATLAMITWYGFAWIYVRWTRGVPRDAVLLRLDAAVGVLVACTAGAWGLGALVPLGLSASLPAEALKHWFLDLFTHGWLLFAVLALARLATAGRRDPGTLPFMLLGLPGLVGLSLPPDALPRAIFVGSGALAALFGAALAVEVLDLARQAPRRWGPPLVALAAVAVGLVLTGALVDRGWASHAGLRLLHLHVLLLGGVTLGLLVAARESFGRAEVPDPRLTILAISAVLATLLPFTPLWPPGLGGARILDAAAWAALLPPAVVILGALRTAARTAPIGLRAPAR